MRRCRAVADADHRIIYNSVKGALYLTRMATA